jgi:hypothetical protein
VKRARDLASTARKIGSNGYAGGFSPERRRELAARMIRFMRTSEFQWSLLRTLGGRDPLIAVEADRRAAKTTTIGAWLGARCVARDRHVVRILTPVLSAPTINWLDRAGDGISFLGLLEEHGLDDPSVVEIRHVQDAIKSIKFPLWGSALFVHDVAHVRAIQKKRGFTADDWWIDEVQSIDGAPKILSELVFPTLGDARDRAKVVCSGTPGKEIGSFFHRCVTGAEKGWTPKRLYSWANPRFGRSDEERWRHLFETTIEATRSSYGLTDGDVELLRSLTREELIAIAVCDDDKLRPEIREWLKRADGDLLRERFGRWAIAANELVYSWTRRDPADFYYGQAVTCKEGYGLPVLGTLAERVAALPKRKYFGREIWADWRAVIGLDLGWDDPNAVVVVVWSPHIPTAYVIWADKRGQIEDSVLYSWLMDLLGEVEALGIPVSSIVADTSNRKGTGAEIDRLLYQRLLAFSNMGTAAQFAQPPAGAAGPIDWSGLRLGKWYFHVPEKHEKLQRIRAFNLDIEAGRIRFLRGDALDIEGSNLRWVPFDPEAPKKPKEDKYRLVVLEDGTQARPGNHCLDALLYAAQDCQNLFAQMQDVVAADMSAAAQVIMRHGEGIRAELRA